MTTTRREKLSAKLLFDIDFDEEEPWEGPSIPLSLEIGETDRVKYRVDWNGFLKTRPYEGREIWGAFGLDEQGIVVAAEVWEAEADDNWRLDRGYVESIREELEEKLGEWKGKNIRLVYPRWKPKRTI